MERKGNAIKTCENIMLRSCTERLIKLVSMKRSKTRIKAEFKLFNAWVYPGLETWRRETATMKRREACATNIGLSN